MIGSFSSRGSLCIGAALAAASFAAVRIVDSTTRVASAFTALIVRKLEVVFDWIVAKVAAVVGKLHRAEAWLVALPAHLVAMRHYVLRQFRMNRPVLQPQWRMAPST